MTLCFKVLAIYCVIIVINYICEHKTSHKQHRYIYNNSQKYIVWVSRLALNGGSRILHYPSSLFFPACFFCLVSSIEETPSARLSKLEDYGFDQLVSQRYWHQLLNEKLGFGGTCLSWRNVRSGLYEGCVGEVANRMSGSSFRGGHWRYLPIRYHDNRYFADWIRLCPGLSKNLEDRNSCPKSHKAARFGWSCGKSGQHWDWDY